MDASCSFVGEVLVEKLGSTFMADNRPSTGRQQAVNDGDSDEARSLRPLQTAACIFRIAFSPRAGQKVLTEQGAMPTEYDFNPSLCACRTHRRWLKLKAATTILA